ncbi:antibiotic biosynthesis monooxygenase [Kozakia baliensis]|uniref:Antibiotic biosynthesis monooxygenase n=2 Tax=Kozakia baliensis TaxID=153496 RepID=A0A1D8UXK9_9PROT|nr:antibiotic biosynthesis monooxygenase [Kozakia baliensis]AOX21387.1 antibiotic biosynthesis monooxygenase [Kozakia baliensis]GEL64332.1 antibiotic biosynthesis monooxygenase [Kozakia baliensis]
MADHLTVIAEFATTPETFEKFLDICRYDSERSVADEEGCHEFNVLTPQDQPDTIVLYEVYAGRPAFETHLKTPHFQKFADALRDLKIQERSVRFFTRRAP